MLTINNIEELRSRIAHKPEIRVSEIYPGYQSFVYMVAYESTFDDAYSRECRGIVFSSETGKVVSRPLHKFFNVNERPSTHVDNLDWSKVTRVMTKLDGSMIHPVMIGDKLYVKTKKSFNSDVAKTVQSWLDNGDNNGLKDFMIEMVQSGKTPIFEWISPSERIVIKYGYRRLRLLHVRDNVTGQYMPFNELVDIAGNRDFRLVKPVDEFNINGKFDISAMLSAASNDETKDKEGWVVQFENGDMVKVKTKWYLQRHKVMTELRIRDIAELILTGNIDDCKSLLLSLKVDSSQIIDIENTVAKQMNGIIAEVEQVWSQYKHLQRKEFAETLKGHDKFNLLMTKYSNKTVDYVKFFTKNILPSYPLDKIELDDQV